MNVETQFFNDILITPYEELLDERFGRSPHCGGPHWPDWENQTFARHYRAGRKVDKEPSFQPATEVYHDLIAWCGAAHCHYGHQIADFSTRILPSLTVQPEVTLGFTVDRNANFIRHSSAVQSFNDILQWLRVKPYQIKIFSQPTIVEKLLVTPQAEQLNGAPPEPEYLDILDDIVRQNIGLPTPKEQIVFISRAGIPDRLAGEAYIEKVLSQSGVRIVRPERIPLAQQLAIYAQTEQLIFTEGSALHSLQLLGRIPAEICVLTRRPQRRLAEAAVAARATRLFYLDATKEQLTEINPCGKNAPNKGLSLLNGDKLLSLLKEKFNLKIDKWCQKSFCHARDMDILAWIRKLPDNSTKQRMTHHQEIVETLAKAELEHLIQEADKINLINKNIAAHEHMAFDSGADNTIIPTFNLITKDN